jgi:O-antigen/teichoic acid export membrane protein
MHETSTNSQFAYGTTSQAEPSAVIILPEKKTAPPPHEFAGASAAKTLSDTGSEDGPSDESLAGSVVWLLVLTSAQKFLGFIRSVLVCRWLDPFHVGLWGMAQAAMDLTVPLLMMSIPGSFSRYMEYYRQRGQLRSFLRWTSLACLMTFVVGLAICYSFRQPIARMVFGDPQYTHLIGLGLIAVIPAAVFAFSVELLLGARQGKTVSLGHFIRGILFTCACLAFLLAWRRDVTAMIFAYGLSFLVAALILVRPIRTVWRHYPPDARPLAVRAAIRRIAPAIFGCWAMDFLNNLFLTVDRYMLIHWSRESNDATLAAIGNYEAALVFPLLLATVAFMMARLVLPHLAKDWEMGNRERVGDSMNLAVQLVAAVLILGGWLLELLQPQIFMIALRGQFPAGQSILPLAVTFYIWMALSWVVMNFLWCVERTPWGALAMIVGLVVNVILNAAWVPTAGILGAAQATMLANAVQLALLLGTTNLFGMRWNFSTLLICATPVLLSQGAGAGAIATILAVAISPRLIRRMASR